MKAVYLGVDAGFSATARTTGLCVIEPDAPLPVRAVHVRTAETISAISHLLGDARPAAISIDGSLVSELSANGGSRYITVNRYRRCEQMLSGGIFQKRCKPGATNTPRGLALHRQATLLANHLSGLFPQAVISESFPNAFLGVMLPDSSYARSIRRGVKSDVFWEHCGRDGGPMRRLLAYLLGRPGAKVFGQSRGLGHHDERAAFVCAVTAIASHQRKAFLVDGGVDGAFALPPERFIQPWAGAVLRARCAPPVDARESLVLA